MDRCLEGCRFPARAFPLEWWTHLHPRGVVRAWAPTGVKVVGSTRQGRCPSRYLASKAVVLKGQSRGVHRLHLPLILYRLSVLPLLKNHQLVLQRSLSKLLWGGARLMVHRQVCYQHPRNGGLGMPDLENHWFNERLAYLGWSLLMDAVWRWKARNTFPCLKSDSKAEGQCKPKGDAMFAREW